MNKLIALLVCLLFGPALFAQSPELLRADSLAEKEEYGAAMALYRQLRRTNPADTSFLVRMARTAEAGRFFPEAIACYDAVLAAGGPSDGLHFAKASLYFGQKRWRDAVESATMALLIREKPEYFGLRADARYKLHMRARAFQDYASAVSKGSRDAAVLSGYAALLIDTGRFDAAFDMANQALALNKDCAAAYAARAKIRICTLLPDSACRDMRRAALLGYNEPFGLNDDFCDEETEKRWIATATYCAQNRQYAQALMAFDTLLAIAPLRARELCIRASCHMALNASDKAEADFMAAEKIADSTILPKVLGSLALMYRKQGRPDMAVSYLSQLMEKRPAGIVELYLRAQQYRLNGTFDKALLDINEALHRNILFASGYAERARILLEMGELPRAEASAKLSIRLNSELGEGYFALGLIKMKLNPAGESPCVLFETARKYAYEDADGAILQYCH